jgi:tRNA dimethylallyltransferase
MNTPLVAIVGPTASGKTALGLELAAAYGGEIISADSRQVYRGMDIGTAKATPEQRGRVLHHAIDLVDPATPFSLAEYQALVVPLIDAIAGRGRLPLLVGGTGQYLAAVLLGWEIPRVAPDHPRRARLAALGAPALHARLTLLDPAAAARIGPGNVRRLVRALEVIELTGMPMSQQQRATPPGRPVITIELDLPNDRLYPRIDARIAQMLADGLLDEVHRLRAAGYGWELPAMSGLGYRQFRPYLEDGATLDACVERLSVDTRAFARRQRSWFRRLPGRVVVDPAAPDARAIVDHALAAQGVHIHPAPR